MIPKGSQESKQGEDILLVKGSTWTFETGIQNIKKGKQIQIMSSLQFYKFIEKAMIVSVMQW